VTEGGAVDDGADILARFATTTPAGSLRASMSDLVTKPSYDFGGDALQKVLRGWTFDPSASTGVATEPGCAFGGDVL